MNLLRLLLVASLVCWINSTWCWSQMIVAHRGASHDAPENTLAAFRLAWEQGSDGIEGDFYLTSDGKIVCIHDRDTERTAGVKRMVEESTLEQLRELEYGGWKHPKWKGEVIPTLEQVLKTVPAGKTFVIELKSKVKIAPVLAKELSRLDTSAIRLLIISFDEATVAECKRLMPNTRAHWLTRFARDESDGGFKPTAAEVAATVRRVGAEGVGMKGQREVINAEFVDALTRQGCPEFHVWTVDDIGDAKYFQALGAVGITTNVPAKVAQGIRKQ